MNMKNVFIGWDPREDLAFRVCQHSIHARSDKVATSALKLGALRESGLVWRAPDPMASTEFTFSRFLVPHVSNYANWSIFMDCDFLLLENIEELFQLSEEKYAVMCVKHEYTPSETTKMDGQVQRIYPRKNWSSLMLFNCAHPSNRKLTPEYVNTASFGDMHRMTWLDDSEIGELPYQWNYLVGHHKTHDAKAVHYTEGGPYFKAYTNVEYGDEWRQEFKEYAGRSFEASDFIS